VFCVNTKNTLYKNNAVNSELSVAVLKFSKISALIALNLFIIYNQKFCRASLLNKLLWISVCARSAPAVVRE